MSDGIPAIFTGEHNLSMKERALSVVLGLGLAGTAIKPHPNPLWNLVGLLGGGYLALRGATGHCPIKAAISGAPEAPPVTIQ